MKPRNDDDLSPFNRADVRRLVSGAFEAKSQVLNHTLTGSKGSRDAKQV